jgi:hypothetical protein
MKAWIRLSPPLWIILLIFSGCTNPDKELTNEILNKPREQRGVALSRLSGEKQVDVYLYAYRRMEPPVILAGELADNWRTTLQPVTVRLAREDNETSAVGLMMILSAISSQYCSLAKRDDVLTAATEAISKIRQPYSELAERQLRLMKTPEKQLPPCR